MTFVEGLQVFGFLSLMMAGIMLLVILFLKFFVALKSPPGRRTLITVGIAYLVTVTFFMFGGIAEYQIWSPILGLPGLILLAWSEHRGFKARWLESAEDLPEGATLSNDDWKVGALIIVSLIAAAAIKVVVREL
jgi:hypothetical protein